MAHIWNKVMNVQDDTISTTKNVFSFQDILTQRLCCLNMSPSVFGTSWNVCVREISLVDTLASYKATHHTACDGYCEHCSWREEGGGKLINGFSTNCVCSS